MHNKEFFSKYGVLHVKDAISKDLREFFTHYLLKETVNPDVIRGDLQVPTAKVIAGHNPFIETFLEIFWAPLEEILEMELVPTYAYARLYGNGDSLAHHTDRPACEISVTIQLGRSHNYAWPIYMGNKRFDLAEGDAVIYKGCDVEHWRNKCDGPDGYYSGQVFLHFVDRNGPYAQEHYCDKTNRKVWKDMFVKNRTHLMDNK